MAVKEVQSLVEINIVHRVTPIPAVRAESCWAAAALVLHNGARPRAAQGTAPTDTPDTGAVATAAHPAHVGAGTLAQFALEWGLERVPSDDWTAPELARIMASRPLWAGAYLPNGHAMVLAGLFGDGSPGGTHVTICDPLPADVGSVYKLPFSVWATRYPLRTMQLLFRPPLSGQRPSAPHRSFQASLGGEE